MRQRQRFRRLAWVALLAAPWLVTTPAIASEDPSEATRTQAAGQWRDAAHLYGKVCTHCHDTGIGPKIKGRQLPQVYIKHVVRNGFKAMPAFRPSDIDAATLAELADMINGSADVAQR